MRRHNTNSAMAHKADGTGRARQIIAECWPRMHSEAKRVAHLGERAVAEAESSVEAESAELLMQSAQAELTLQRKTTHDLDHHDIVLMDKGAEPHEFDQRERLWNRELRQEAEWGEWTMQMQD